MAFSAEQITKLEGDLDLKHVKSRKGAGGMTLSYIEGWHAIAEANRIFGFDAWSSETMFINVVHAAEGSGFKWGKQKGERVACRVYNVSYIAKVRVTVTHAGGVVVREGVGTGHGKVTEDEFGSMDIGGAHESALKEAERDAQKRALMQFGNKFGLALYDKHKANVSIGADEADEAAAAAAAAKPEKEMVTPPKPGEQKPLPPKVPAPASSDAPAEKPAEKPAARKRRVKAPAPPAPVTVQTEKSGEVLIQPDTGEILDALPDGVTVPFAPSPRVIDKHVSQQARQQVTKHLDSIKAKVTGDLLKAAMQAYEALRDTLKAEMLPEDWQKVLDHQQEWKAQRAQTGEVDKLKQANNVRSTNGKPRVADRQEASL